MSAPLVFAQQVVETLGGHAQPDAKLARQMQALSLTVHIPIVCFGIAFPAMFLFVEGLYLRTGDPTYKALAKRWSKVALIAVRGRRRHRHDPVVRVRAAVAGVHGARSATCSGSAFALEGISFFVEAIFIAIYVYGWDRLSPRAHFLTGIPVVISRLRRARST